MVDPQSCLSQSLVWTHWIQENLDYPGMPGANMSWNLTTYQGQDSVENYSFFLVDDTLLPLSAVGIVPWY